MLPGEYTLQIYNLWNNEIYQGEKHLFLLKLNWLGGKNLTLGIFYLIIGSLSMVLSILAIIRKYQRPNGILYYKINKVILYSESKLALNNWEW